MSKLRQINQFVEAVSSILGIIDTYLASKMKEVVDVAVQLQTNKLREEAQAENQEFLNQIEKYVTESLGAEVLVRSTNQPQTAYAVAAFIRVETTETKINTPLLDQTKGRKEGSQARKLSHPKIQGKSAHAEEPSHIVDDSGVQQDQEFDTGNNDKQPTDKEVSKDDWFKKPERPPTPDFDWNKRQHVDSRPPQTWISQVARAKEPRTSFDELMDTSFDFSAFVLNRLNIKDLTQEILVGPAFELLKGTCKSLTELEYHLEECSKATTERLDWHNPEGKPYPFDLSKPLPLIRDHRGRQVIP
ncbi:hypothetical protein Tco_0051218 [Tanacetum coccineum]